MADLWTNDEDRRLLKAFYQDTSLADLAKAHYRPKAAIAKRLCKLEVLVNVQGVGYFRIEPKRWAKYEDTRS